MIGFEPWEDFPFNHGMLCPKGVKRWACRARIQTAGRTRWNAIRERAADFVRCRTSRRFSGGQRLRAFNRSTAMMRSAF
ncbi:MAG: hypothetical protein U0Y68_15880 [Blastocatellia bacterium]